MQNLIEKRFVQKPFSFALAPCAVAWIICFVDLRNLWFQGGDAPERLFRWDMYLGWKTVSSDLWESRVCATRQLGHQIFPRAPWLNFEAFPSSKWLTPWISWANLWSDRCRMTCRSDFFQQMKAILKLKLQSLWQNTLISCNPSRPPTCANLLVVTSGLWFSILAWVILFLSPSIILNLSPPRSKVGSSFAYKNKKEINTSFCLYIGSTHIISSPPVLFAAFLRMKSFPFSCQILWQSPNTPPHRHIGCAFQRRNNDSNISIHIWFQKKL